MNNLNKMAVSDFQESEHEFYPTPKALAEKMFEGIDLSDIRCILEPSAGKGDLLRVLAPIVNDYAKYSHARAEFDVDCIEIDPNLRQILKYNFGERKDVVWDKHCDIEKKLDCRKNLDGTYSTWDSNLRTYIPIPSDKAQELKELDYEMSTFFPNGIHIVHDDFLTYVPFKKYDLIVMNPPFSNGDAHLLKALDMQKNGGSIICLLNAETIKNPYTERRKQLMKLLQQYNANIEFMSGAFSQAERSTNVEVAIVKVYIPTVHEESDIFQRFQKAAEIEEFDIDNKDLEVSDYIKAMVSHYQVEVKSGIELIRQYTNLEPYMKCTFDTKDWNSETPIIHLSFAGSSDYVTVNGYLKEVRYKYWKALLSNPKFVGKLTTKLQEDYREEVSRFADYDFTEFNINALSAEMNSKIKKGIEEAIIEKFNTLTEEHSWYPETMKNRHYYDGWATNKAHKIDKKVIIPCYGIFSSWSGKPSTCEASKVLFDLEKILNFFDGNMTAEVGLESTLEEYFRVGETKKIPLKYFKATFYKKGTVHLEFTCPELIERFNIYAGQRKGWLPPCYGKKKYKDMNVEEKAVVDSFQGEEAYNEIMAKADYYLAPVTNDKQVSLLDA